jgi:hypothetical protein
MLRTISIFISCLAINRQVRNKSPPSENTNNTMASTTNNIEVDPELVFLHNFKLTTLDKYVAKASSLQQDSTDTEYATSGYETGSTSLSSTVNQYVFENGI